MSSTSINPGAFNKQHSFGLWRAFKRILNSLLKGNWRLFLNSFQGELANFFNQTLGTGGNYQCNVCKYDGKFVHLYNAIRITWNSACPNCDSRSRHRGLYYLYQDICIRKDHNWDVLHFAPEPIFYPLLRVAGTINYKTTDYLLQDVDFPREDIQKLSFATNSFDCVLCNHVIEHVPDDNLAFSELSRILRSGGFAIITIPGDYDRQETIYFDHLKHNGHYRDYGLDVLVKLKVYFNKVETIDLGNFNGREGRNHAIRKKDTAFICYK